MVGDGRGRMTGNPETQFQIIRNLAAAQSFEEIREVVTRAARNLLAADGVTFVLREGDLCYYAEEDAIAPLWKGRRFPMSACISGWAMRERKPVRIKDIYANSRIPHDVYQPTFVRSLAMVPLEQDDPTAAMGAYWSNKRTLSS
jgi:putative two-component system response regulator